MDHMGMGMQAQSAPVSQLLPTPSSSQCTVLLSSQQGLCNHKQSKCKTTAKCAPTGVPSPAPSPLQDLQQMVGHHLGPVGRRPWPMTGVTEGRDVHIGN